MKTRLQLTLLLSFIFIFCSQSIDNNAFDKNNIIVVDQAIEENANDNENHDLDSTAPSYLFGTSLRSLVEKHSHFNISQTKSQLTYGFIRAPPRNHV